MKKLLVWIMCTLLVLTSFPASTLAVDDADSKAQFIAMYVSSMEKAVAIQNSVYTAAGGSVSINATAQNINISLPGQGPEIQDGAAQGKLDIKYDLPNNRSWMGINASYLGKTFQGEAYIDGNRLVVPRETILSLDKYFPASGPIMERYGLSSLPEFLVFPGEQDLMGLSGSQSMSQPIMEQQLLVVKEVLNCIPAQCFSFSEGSYTFTYDNSPVTMLQFINQLKDRKSSIAAACAELLPRSAGMSDAEYMAARQTVSNECSEFIGNLSSATLADLAESGIKIEKIVIRAAEDRIMNQISITANPGEVPLTRFTLESSVRFENGQMAAESEIQLASAAASDSRFNVKIEASGWSTNSGFNQEVTLHPDLKWDGNLIQGDIRITSQGTFINTVIDVPQLTSQNSAVLKVSQKDPQQINVILNGKLLEFADARPIIVNDRVLVPLRAVAEEMDCTVEWQPPKYVTIVNGQTSFMLTIGSKQIRYASGKSKTMDVAPAVINSRTYVPVRFVSEEMGMNVAWDSPSRTVIISRLNL